MYNLVPKCFGAEIFWDQIIHFYTLILVPKSPKCPESSIDGACYHDHTPCSQALYRQRTPEVMGLPWRASNSPQNQLVTQTCHPNSTHGYRQLATHDRSTRHTLSQFTTSRPIYLLLAIILYSDQFIIYISIYGFKLILFWELKQHKWPFLSSPNVEHKSAPIPPHRPTTYIIYCRRIQPTCSTDIGFQHDPSRN